jgi:hypothetical protein
MSPSTYCVLNRLATIWNMRLALAIAGGDGALLDI